MQLSIRQFGFVGTITILAWLAAPAESQAGWLLDWLTGWRNGYQTVGYSPANVAYYPNYQDYPSQVGTYAPIASAYPTQTVGYAPAAGSYNAYAAYSPVTSPTIAYQNPVGGCNTCAQPVATTPVATLPIANCNSCTQQTFRQQVVNYLPQTYYRTTYRRIPVTNYRPVLTNDPVTGCPVTAMQPCVTYTYQAARVPFRFLRPITSTVPASPCTPCATGSAVIAPGAVPYYNTTPAVQAPGIITAPSAAPIQTSPSIITTPGLGGIQPADVRPSLAPGSYGPTPDTGVGSRVNYPPADGSSSQLQPQLQPQSQYVPPAAPQSTSSYQPFSTPTIVRPQSSVRVQRQETPQPATTEGTDSNLRPIPRISNDADSTPAQPTTGVPDLLDPRDRTATRPQRDWAYSLIAWPETKPATPPATANAATLVAGVEADSELNGPVLSQPRNAAPRKPQPQNWDDSGWESVGY